MNVANKAIQDILKNADPQSRRVMANILTGKIIANIYCLSTDIKAKREVPTLDKKGKRQYHETGKNAGQLITHEEEYLERKGCNGRLIGQLYDFGRDKNGEMVTRAEPVKADDGKYYLRSTRKRLDGAIGVECWCGQDSRISAQEAGHIDFNGQPPSKEGLESIFKNVQKNPTVVAIKNGRTEIDGFAFEELR